MDDITKDNIKDARPDEEQPAVSTTIVGGRPPGPGQAVGDVPRGVEVLIKKAAVDAAFRDCLLSERDGAAAKIGLALEPAEAAMLRGIPAAQLAAVVARTRVSPNLHAAFMTYTAAVMLAALGAVAAGCKSGGDTTTNNTPRPTGIQPDWPPTVETAKTAGTAATAATAGTAIGNAGGYYETLPGSGVGGGLRPDMPISHDHMKNGRPVTVWEDDFFLTIHGAEEGDENRSHEAINKVIKEYLPSLRRAYVRALRDKPSLEGNINVLFEISVGGEVKYARIEPYEERYSAFKDVVVPEIEKWKFAPTKGDNVWVSTILSFHVEEPPFGNTTGK